MGRSSVPGWPGLNSETQYNKNNNKRVVLGRGRAEMEGEKGDSGLNFHLCEVGTFPANLCLQG